MPDTHKLDIKKLEKKVTDLSDALARLGSREDFKRLILIFRRPGWTTPAEYLFATALVDSMQSQVATLAKLKTDLLKGSKEVGR
jgi:hypothetical protein